MKPIFGFFITGLLLCGLVTGWFFLALSGPFTPKAIAKSLLEPYDVGSASIERALAHDEKVSIYLKDELKDLSAIKGYNAERIGDFLSRSNSIMSMELLDECYKSNLKYARLTGSIGLAWKGEKGIDTSFLIGITEKWTDHHYSKKPKYDRPVFPSQWDLIDLDPDIELSLKALGFLKDPAAIPYIAKVAEAENTAYQIHTAACEALGRIQDKSAIPILRGRLKDPGFYALPEAFKALIILGDKEAIPLAIARISPEIKEKNSGFVVKELGVVTGKNFGFDKEKWQTWWNAEGKTWTIPPAYIKKVLETWSFWG